MKSILFPTFALVSSAAFAADPPKALSEFLPANSLVKAEIVVVVPPPEIDKYVGKVEESARKDPTWFAEHSKNSKPGVPLPYDEKLGLTKEEYDEYLKLWAKREFKPVEAAVLQLKEGKDGTWTIGAAGSANIISLLKFDPAKNEFKSLNGDLKALPDVNADANSTLGAWTGHEWKYEEEDGLSTTKENIAIGKTADGKYGLIVYRLQEVSSAGTHLMDKGMVVRFLLGEAGLLKEKDRGGPAPAAPGGTTTPPPAKPATPPAPSKPKKK
jgi:hypothetical protein